MKRSRRLAAIAMCAVSLSLIATACGGDDDEATGTGAETAAASADALKVGFIYVGPKDDFGYNQAAYEGSEAMAQALEGQVELIQAENVPENAEAERVMERMISDGAEVIFATSYGHLAPAVNVAKNNPDVTIVHQGGLEPEPKMDNLGTYFGTVYEPVYLAGVAAGKATTTNKLGYIVAFPIPQTLANVNAFQLGAASVNPDVTTTMGFTSNWCNPATQAEATEALLSQDVDVISQHQDCTKTIIQTAEAGGAKSVGYHYDASELAPEGWVTGSEWNWAPLYTDIVESVLAGEFVESPYNGDYRVGLQTGDNPFVSSPFGASVTEETKEEVAAAEERIVADGVFVGPVIAQDGSTAVPEGESLDYAAVEQMDFLVQGVQGNLPE